MSSRHHAAEDALISVEDFRARLNPEGIEDLADEILLADGAAHVSADQMAIIEDRFRRSYRLGDESLRLIITGSAKLGFSLVDKTDAEGNALPRYRPFDAQSDIDIAVLAPDLFGRIWLELSLYASRRTWFPLRHKDLGSYLVSGWLRPDHFPYSSALPMCRKWFPTFSDLSSDTRLGRRKVTGGLFYSKSHLRQYQLRSLRLAMTGNDL